MSKLSIVFPFKCSKRYKIVLDHLRLSVNVFNMVLMYKISVKYQYAGRAGCTYAHDFWKRQGYALIGACALIRTNPVYDFIFF